MCNGQLVTTANSTLPLIVAGAPTVTMGLTSWGRLVALLGLTLIMIGTASLALSVRSRRQIIRTYAEVPS